MTIKSALSVIALSAGLMAAPVLAQDMMIGTQTVAETDVAAVQARCDELQLAATNQSLSATPETDEGEATPGEAPANDATIQSVPDTDGVSATSIDLNIITLADCEAGGWFDM